VDIVKEIKESDKRNTIDPQKSKKMKKK